MSTTNTIDLSQNPKNVIANTFLKLLAEASFFIFVRPELEATGLNVLDCIISSMGPQHQKKLAEKHKQIRAASRRGGPKIDVRQAYQDIFAYLHTTPYFIDVGIGIIPMGTIAPGEHDRTAPQEKITKRVKAKLG